MSIFYSQCRLIQGRVRIVSVGLLALLLISFMDGCASFSGKEIPAYSYADLAPASAEKMCLVVKTDGNGTNKYLDTAIDMFEKSGYFLKSPEHCSPTGEEIQNGLSIGFRNDFKFSNMAVAVISGFMSGASMTIIPGYGRDEYILNVRLANKKRLIKEYTYHEHIDTWFHLSMLFVIAGHMPGDTVQEVYARMLMNFLYDYSHDVQQGKLAALIN